MFPWYLLLEMETDIIEKIIPIESKHFIFLLKPGMIALTLLLKEHTIRTLFFLAVFGTPSDLDFFGTGGIGAKISKTKY